MRSTTLILALGLFVALPASATRLINSNPNHYSCEDEFKTIQVSYSTSSLSGAPLFNYTRLIDGPGSRQVAVGGSERISVVETILGKQVSVQDPTETVPDMKAEHVTLILPDINLQRVSSDPVLKRVEFNTVVVETLARTSIGGTRLVRGAVQSSNFFPVKCVARKVLF